MNTYIFSYNNVIGERVYFKVIEGSRKRAYESLPFHMTFRKFMKGTGHRLESWGLC